MTLIVSRTRDYGYGKKIVAEAKGDWVRSTNGMSRCRRGQADLELTRAHRNLAA